MTRHLITGSTGQDGILLTRLLLEQGHQVVAAQVDVTDTAAFADLVAQERPDVVHNLAGRSSVSQSWREPEQSDLVNRQAVIGMLEVVSSHPDLTFIQASSAEIFGAATTPRVSETTPLDPQSPYAGAKAAAHRAVQQARSEGIRASNLVLFGHTSELQPTRFALAAMCAKAAEVATGAREGLDVQDPDVRRDWGSARDHVRAFALAAQGEPDDYVIGTGVLTRLGDVIGWALEAAGVPGAPITVTGSDRPVDHDGLAADFSLARAKLGWEPRIPLREEIERMVRARL